MEAPVTLEVDDAVARVVLSRGDAYNAIDRGMIDALASAVEALGARSDVRAVLVAADGPNFTVGGDRDHIADHIDDMAEQLAVTVPTYHAALLGLADLPVPVVCAAQGVVAGGGLGLLWVADVVLAAADLKIVTAFAKLGLSGDGGSSWALPRLVGLRRASQLMLGGRVLGAEDARAWGLVDQVVEPANLRIEAEAAAREYADGPTVAYGQMRRLLRGAYHMTWAEQLAAEEAAMVSCGGTDDSREGATALAERRAPKFQGR